MACYRRRSTSITRARAAISISYRIPHAMRRSMLPCPTRSALAARTARSYSSASDCQSPPMTVVRRELPGARDLLALAAAQPQRYPCLLESAAQGGRQARYDILFAFPSDALALGSDGRVRDAQ